MNFITGLSVTFLGEREEFLYRHVTSSRENRIGISEIYCQQDNSSRKSKIK